jgi:hypothetical protein
VASGGVETTRGGSDLAVVRASSSSGKGEGKRKETPE